MAPTIQHKDRIDEAHSKKQTMTSQNTDRSCFVVEQAKEDPVQDMWMRTFQYTASKTSAACSILSTLKIEVIVFVYMFSYVIRSVSSMTMIIDKVCRSNMNYSTIICDNIHKEEYKEYKASVETLANNYHLYHTLLEVGPSVITTAMIGPWSDLYGRKPPLVASLIGILIDGVGAALCAYYMDSGAQYYLIPAIFGGMSGGMVTIFTIVYSYASDLTKSGSRTVKYACLEMAFGLGVPLGNLVGGWIFNFFGYLPVFVTSICGHLLGLAWVIFVMEETRGLDNKDSFKDKVWWLFSTKGFKESYQATMKKRPHKGRMQIWLMILALGFGFLSIMGSMAVAYLYTYHRYAWSNTKFSTVNAISSVLGLIVMIIVVPLLTKVWKVGDSTLGIIGTVSTLASNLCKAASYKEWIYYLANVLGFLQPLCTMAGRARISKIVSKNDLGKVFAFLSTAEAVVPIIATVSVSQLFNATVRNHPGITYFILALTMLIPLAVYIWMACLPAVDYSEMNGEDEQKDEEPMEEKAT